MTEKRKTRRLCRRLTPVLAAECGVCVALACLQGDFFLQMLAAGLLLALGVCWGRGME